MQQMREISRHKTYPGYPAYPDHSKKAKLFTLLNATATTSISITKNYAMYPAAARLALSLA